MGRADRLRAAALLLAVVLAGCAGAPPESPPPAANAVDVGDQRCGELLTRLDELIALRASDPTTDPAPLAEARALRTEAIAQLAAGDDELAHDLLIAALSLLERGRG